MSHLLSLLKTYYWISLVTRNTWCLICIQVNFKIILSCLPNYSWGLCFLEKSFSLPMCNCTAADKIKSLDWAGDRFSAKGPECGSEPPPVWRWLEMKAGISFLSQFASEFYSWIIWIVHLWQKYYNYVDSFHVCICGQASIFSN